MYKRNFDTKLNVIKFINLYRITTNCYKLNYYNIPEQMKLNSINRQHNI